MRNQRTHYVTTTDGVAIGGTVHGDGPPLVFLQGIFGDADLDWGATISHLTDRFTCHLPSMRGRGLSGDHADLGPDRIVGDFVAYVESIGEPAGVVGWSGGGAWALYAAAQSDAVRNVAALEPGLLYLLDEPEQAALGGALGRAGELAADGKLSEAARVFARWPFTEQEVDAAESAGYFAAVGRYIPKMLNAVQQQMQSPPDGDPAAPLAAISVPVLVLLGSESKPFFRPIGQHAADHVPNARIQEISGVGHAAPITHPEPLAQALRGFFS